MINQSPCNLWSVPSSIPGSPSLSDETYAMRSPRSYEPELLLVEPSGAPGHKITKPQGSVLVTAKEQPKKYFSCWLQNILTFKS